MEENANTNGTNNEANGGAPERTFSQSELNSIVERRVAEERAKAEAFREKASKYDELEEARKSELQKAQEKAEQLQAKVTKMEKDAEISRVRAKVAAEKGVPSDLLTGETEEACAAQADAILKFAQNNGYPNLQDGGEAGGSNKPSAREAFKQWAANVP